ncbi:hypothetical protein [Nonomuraea wenchangensis]|uniref:Uncharacterized protein n=1 Tax=Nonomuraea wenchangensis TaxID=568860 RepID=A0A1I0EXJ3_9ACTN|nr:hypothetical protein [Nonomuraea wenchangensis]SET50239.1 hypothetical protein SAMN05421811_103245 [Nonomuraea wenchangensis]
MNPFDPGLIPLSYFEVECDGSACGSGPVGWHTHPEQRGREPLGRVRVTEGRRTYLTDVRPLPEVDALSLAVRELVL